MERSCERCGALLVAKSPRARFCGSVCRAKASRERRLAASLAPAAAAEQPPAESEGLVAAVVRQLTSAGSIDTYAAQQALVLAERMSSSRSNADTGSAVAAVSKELDRLMSILLSDVKPKADLLDGLQDEVAQMRSRRRG